MKQAKSQDVMMQERAEPQYDDIRNAAVLHALDSIGNKDATYKCGALKRDGSPCEKWALRGFDRCLLHGGGTALAKNAIKKRLLALAGPALDRLVELMSSSDDKVALAATIGLLDRAGLGPHAVVDVNERRQEIADLSDEALAQRLRQSLRELAERRSTVIDIESHRPDETPAELEAQDAAQERLASELTEKDETAEELERLQNE